MSYLDAYHAWLNSPALSAAEKAELASIQGDDKEIESLLFHANEGKIKKVANSTYIITPYNVDIMGDLIDELENSGMYF